MAPRSRPRRGKARVRAIEAGREEGKDGVVRTASLFLSISCFGGPISRLQPQPALVLLRHSVCCTQRNGTGDGASPGTLPRGGEKGGSLRLQSSQPPGGRLPALTGGQGSWGWERRWALYRNAVDAVRILGRSGIEQRQDEGGDSHGRCILRNLEFQKTPENKPTMLKPIRTTVDKTVEQPCSSRRSARAILKS